MHFGYWNPLARRAALRNTLSMRRFFRILAGACGLIFTLLPAWSEEGLTVFAAASLKGALDEASALYGSPISVSYGGSGLIARQVSLGAPADLVILANRDWMDWIASKGRPKLLSRNDLLGNKLVIIGPANAAPLAEISEAVLLDRLGDGRLAVGMIQSVPAGIYAGQWMERAGLWSVLQTRLAQTDNVRAALALVARGEAPLGIVYASDALADETVTVLYEIPPESHDRIVYPMAVIDSKNALEASDLAVFLRGTQSMTVFASHGFSDAGVTP